MAGGEPKTILVVDDDPDIREVLSAMLMARSFEITCASDGATMRDAIAQQHYDLVVLDERMPSERGSALAPLAKARGIPVILMSGAPDALPQFGDGEIILAKPFGCDLLYAAVEAALLPRHPSPTPMVAFVVAGDDRL